MLKKSKSFIATPPGATIKEQLETRGMSQKSLPRKLLIGWKWCWGCLPVFGTI